MKQSSKRLLSFGIALVCAVGTMIVFFSFVEPVYVEIIKTKAILEGKQHAMENQRQMVSKVKNLISASESEDTKKKVEAVSLALPSVPDVAGALAQINGLAANSNISPQSFSVSIPNLQVVSNESKDKKITGAISLAKPIGTIVLQTVFSGTYEDFKRFLKTAETNIRILDVKSITLQPAGTKPNQNLFTYIVSLAVYYQTK